MPTHLCRLRYHGNEDSWAMAFYKYSDEKYEPSFFNNGTFHGTPEEAFETSAVYLQPRPCDEGCRDSESRVDGCGVRPCNLQDQRCYTP
ncbi:MAG TPA: hypothetical protein VM123_21580 [archaeon]|nr:hypothetical protein [archaeon]